MRQQTLSEQGTGSSKHCQKPKLQFFSAMSSDELLKRLDNHMAVLLETSMGDLVIDLHTQEAPETCKNFLKLCKVKFYNAAQFFHIEPGWLLTCGRLDTDQSIYGLLHGQEHQYIKDEFHPLLRHDRVGVVSMANRGPDMSASQFFIMLANRNERFDRVHPVFGQVAEGLEVLEKISSAYCDAQGRPYQEIRIRQAHILDDPFEDPEGLLVPASPQPTADPDRLTEQDMQNLPAADSAQVQASIKELEAKTRAVVLELIGDLPDADIKPPENVAFVCRLNPVTTDSDVLMIFSRFGPIKRCEVVKDWKTGQSLQYAFVEFENIRDCEEAVLKMDGVLVDERRIRVDFSQSVAKLWRKYRRGQKPKDEDQAELEKTGFKIKENVHDRRFKDDRHKMLFEDSDDEGRKHRKRHRSRSRQ